MSHHHHHEHSHAHGEHQGTMSVQEKLAKLFEHWIKHNSDHAGTYQQWAERAEAEGMGDVARLLREVEQMTLDMNEKFEQGARLLKS